MAAFDSDKFLEAAGYDGHNHGQYVHWPAGCDGACLDGDFTPDDLRKIATAIEASKGDKAPGAGYLVSTCNIQCPKAPAGLTAVCKRKARKA